MDTRVAISCISWIDRTPLPQIWLSDLVDALFKWPEAVITGLVATSNPTPETTILSLSTFQQSKQYRALQSCVIDLSSSRISGEIQDAGFTPPFDETKINTRFGSFVPGPTNFSPGERSALSRIMPAGLHPCSALTLRAGDKVIVSGLIKFRAGKDTDTLGIEKAKSPVHVPWVWQEFALVSNAAGYRLVCNGSKFPSHAWYINGKQVATIAQAPVTTSKQDAILTVGRPAVGQQTDARMDKSEGRIGSHPETIPAAGQQDIVLKL